MSMAEESSRENSPELRKRKRQPEEEVLEINLDAPEPPSKKALRRAKKIKNTGAEETREDSKSKINETGVEDVVSNRGKRSEFGIWIGNLSFATTKEDLLRFMMSDTAHPLAADKVTRINLPAGPVKFGKFQNKGFAYIDLLDAGALDTALQMSERLLGGRRVLIKNANNFEGRPKDSVKEVLGHPPSKRVFVGNLDFDTTVDDLENHFGVCGPIHHTQMATFEDSGKCKGYAWIEFEQLSSGQAAMRGWIEQGQQPDEDSVKRSKQRIWLGKINGRKLRMEFAEDKTTRYNKRFGKNASKDVNEDSTPAIEEVSDTKGDTKAPIESQKPGHFKPALKQFQRQDRPSGNGRKQRYAEETVKRLTGAIVEAKGQKVTFE